MDTTPTLVTGLERHFLDARNAGQSKRSMVVEGLAANWPSDYWPSLAIKSLEDGFPIDEEIAVLLEAASCNRSWSQRVRHRALAALVSWKREQPK